MGGYTHPWGGDQRRKSQWTDVHSCWGSSAALLLRAGSSMYQRKLNPLLLTPLRGQRARMLRPLPLPLRTPGLLKLSMPSGVIIALTAGIGAAADAATGAAATTDRVTTMDRATDLTVGTGGDVVVAIGGVVTTGETDPVAAHAR